MDQLGKLFTVAGATTWVYVHHHVSRGGVQLDLGGEVRAIGRVGSTVNFQQQRVVLGRIKTRGPGHPSLDLAAVVARIHPHFFDWGHAPVLDQVGVEVCQATGLAGTATAGNIRRRLHIAPGIGPGIFATDCKGSAGIGPAQAEPTQVTAEDGEFAAQAEVGQYRITLVVILDEDTLAIR